MQKNTNNGATDLPQAHDKKLRSAAIGGAFLMAMSAVGPGFLTQTATFTSQLGADFGFAILICILVDIVVQLLSFFVVFIINIIVLER